MNVPQLQRAASPPFRDAEGAIQRGIEVVDFATGALQLLKGGITENAGTCERDLRSIHFLEWPVFRGGHCWFGLAAATWLAF
jgi:hypothetical protein